MRICLDAFYRGDQVYKLPGQADETVDCSQMEQSNRYINVIDLAGGNLWNRHWLECALNQSAFKIKPTCCTILCTVSAEGQISGLIFTTVYSIQLNELQMSRLVFSTVSTVSNYAVCFIAVLLCSIIKMCWFSNLQ